jgi:hypothetical protein
MKPGIALSSPIRTTALLAGLLLLGSMNTPALDWNPRLVGQWPPVANGGGISVAAASVFGGYGYLAEGSDGIEVLDLSQPPHPISLGRAATSGPAQGIAVSGALVCVMTDTSLEVFDVSDPLNPHRVGALDGNAGGFGAASPFAVAAHCAYVTGPSNLSVIDIGDPSNPHRVGGVQTGGTTVGLAASNGMVCLAEDMGLEIVDVSDPANPRVAGALPITDGVNQVGLLGQYACAATADLRLVVVDITDPTAPHQVGSLNLPLGTIASLAVSPPFVYEFDDFGLEVLDLSAPAAPRLAGGLRNVSLISLPQPASAVGGYVYTADYFGNLQIIDANRAANPQQLGSYSGTRYSLNLAVSGSLAYLVDGAGLNIVDVSNPTNFQSLGRYATTNILIQAVAGSGGYAALITGALGTYLEFVDASDPAHPRLAAQASLRCGSGVARLSDVAIAGHYVFLAGSCFGFGVLDITDPANPTVAASLSLEGGATHLVLSGDRVCVSDSVGPFVWIISVADPANPVVLGHVTQSSPSDAVGMSFSGNYAALWYTPGPGSTSLELIDFSNPAQPLTWTYPSIVARGATVLDGCLYVAGGPTGLEVFELSHPDPPALVGVNAALDDAWSVLAQGGKLYVRDSFGVVAFHPFVPLRFLSAPRLDATGAHVWLQGGIGQHAQLQRSLDLKTWSDWQLIDLTGAPIEVIDSQAAAQPRTFYRAMIP